jgi:hypothetical protein
VLLLYVCRYPLNEYLVDFEVFVGIYEWVYHNIAHIKVNKNVIFYTWKTVFGKLCN